MIRGRSIRETGRWWVPSYPGGHAPAWRRRVARTWRSVPYRHFVIYLVFAWGIQDTATTLVAARAAGSALEANPLVRATLEISPLLTVALKLSIALVAGAAALRGERFITAVPYWRLWFAQLVLVGMVVSAVNLAVAWRAAGPIVPI